MMHSLQIQGLSIIKLDNNIFVSGQITENMMKEISELGVKLIISNRPEGESYDQPCNSDLENKSKLYSIEFKSIPFSSSSLSRQKIDDLSILLKNNKNPVLMYCKSGARSAWIWALSNILNSKTDISKISKKLKDSGYDASVLASLVEQFR